MDSDKWIKQFILDYQFQLDSRTLEAYHLSVKRLLDHTRISFAAITKRDIRHWLNHLTENGYQPSTINTNLAGVKLFLNIALKKVLSNRIRQKIFRSQMWRKNSHVI
jgi:site-specific recombinase XerD